MIASDESAAPSRGSSTGDTRSIVPDKPPVVAASGLTTAEAARLLSKFGPNQVETVGRFHMLRMGLGLLANPLVLILLAASVVSGIVGEALDAGIIVTIVLVSVGLDFFQIFHSEQAASKLQSLVTLTASVWRDGAAPRDPHARGGARRCHQRARWRSASGRCAPGVDRDAQRRPGRADRRIVARRETRG